MSGKRLLLGLTALLLAALGALYAPSVDSRPAADPPGAAVSLADVDLDETTLRIHFIDVGPGMAILVQTPNDRRTIFIDGGKWSLQEMENYVQHFVPTDRSVDLAVVTHADLDHYRGLMRILDAYDVREFWYTGYTSAELDATPLWGDFLTKVQTEEGCVARNPVGAWRKPGERETIDDGGTPETRDDVVVTFLNVDADPPARDPIFGRSFNESERRNNASLVFRLSYGPTSFLFTGDVNGREKEHESEETEDEIDSEELELWVRHQLKPECSLAATVLQAPHHGSNGSCSLPFLKAVSPEWVVITAGHQYDHPTAPALARIAKAGVAADHVLRTDEGDSTPEDRDVRDVRCDDNIVFEVDESGIVRILRISGVH